MIDIERAEPSSMDEAQDLKVPITSLQHPWTISKTTPTTQHTSDPPDLATSEKKLTPTKSEPISSITNTGPTGPTFSPLRQTNTALSTLSGREAAQTLENYESSPHNPRNWPNRKKWRITLIVALTAFITTCGSSISVPGVHAAMSDFGETNEKIGILIVSFYVLGLGTGPFIFAPISELWGRQAAYHSSESMFILFCLGTACSQNMATLIILRFFCGMFGSIGTALGVATCADMFAPDERGKPVSIYSLGPFAGPVLGNMLGYWLVLAGWRWLFWFITILAAGNWVLLLCFTEETFAPVLQKKLLYMVRHPQPVPVGFRDRISPLRFIRNLGWMRVMVSGDEARTVFSRAVSRPPRLLLTNPVAFIFSAYYSYIYGIIYVFLVSVPLLFGSAPYNRAGLFSYEWSAGILSLSYIGMAIGFLAASATASNLQDRIHKYLSKRNGDGPTGQPEYRLVLTQTGMIIMPIGLFIFGWTANAHTHWIGPQIGNCLVAYGLMLAFNTIQNFIVDAFYPYSSAATAGATTMRSLVASVLPIFSADLFRNLGWGWGCSLLAFVALVAVPAPVVPTRKVQVHRLNHWIHSERINENDKKH